MKKIVGLIIIISTILSLSFLVYGENEGDDQVEKRLLIVYKEDMGNQRQAKELGDEFERLPKSVKSKIKKRKKLESLDMDIVFVDENEDIDEVIKELEDNQYIERVEEDGKRKLFFVPNDTSYDLQWGLHNTNINISEAWRLIENSGKTNEEVVVAVIDSGINAEHEDLINRIESGGYNFESNNENVDDNIGHGTAVAGVISAEANNNRGIAGVAGVSKVKILPLKINLLISEEVEAIDYAIENNVDVINLSLGGEDYREFENRAIQRAVDAGIIVVAAAGNEAQEGNPIVYPASYENVISVGAVGEFEETSFFSNYNSYVDLAAPGEWIYTTNFDGEYKYYHGTSFSSPFVAGVCALLKSVDKTLTPGEVEDILFSTAIDRGESGRDDYYGYGIVNPAEAIKELLQRIDNNPPRISLIGESRISILVGTKYEDLGATATDDVDGDISESIVVVNPVDINKPGTYTITYNVSDSAGNRASQVTRTVVVIENGEYEVFEEITDVELNKNWTIKFNMELDEATINDSNVYILNKDGEKNNCEISLNTDKKGIIIAPKSNYNPAEEYSLIISKNIKSTSNKSLAKAVKMTFVTKPSSE